MKSKRLLRMTTPVGPPFEIAYHDIGPQRQTPAVALVAGIHGNELNGIYVLARLAGWLRKIYGGQEPGIRLTKRILILPVVNVIGMHTRSRVWPFDKTDINRMFPGYHAGETTQRIADAVFKLTRQAAIRIDMHSSNLEFEELPQVRLYGPSKQERATALKMGLPAVVECPSNRTSQSTLLHAWKQTGGQNFVVQGGSAGDLQLPHCHQLHRALCRLLRRLKILQGDQPLQGVDLTENTQQVHYFKEGHTVSLISEKAGLYVMRAELGRWIKQGDLLGDIYDGFNGRLRSHVRAPVDGFLTGRRRQALLYQGDLLARIQSLRPVRNAADTYLIGQGQ